MLIQIVFFNLNRFYGQQDQMDVSKGKSLKIFVKVVVTLIKKLAKADLIVKLKVLYRKNNK